ncbi:MAG TPA: hypothetical protein VK689_09005, partial [Armatimonadota bacterium]|nr:hypothetical protein [Armatimonadota bacterium]
MSDTSIKGSQSSVAELGSDSVGRRDAVTKLLGVLGVAALAGCGPDLEASTVQLPAEDVDTLHASLNGSEIKWVSTVLGFDSSGVRQGDLATQADTALSAKVVIAQGCNVPGDGGGGIFYWSASGTDDGGTFIVPNATTGATGVGWRRLHSGELSVRWFGARGDGTTDAAAFTAALAAGAAVVVPTGGTYRLGSSLTVPKGKRLRVEPSALLDLPAGVTLTIEGEFHAGLHQVFSGEGSVVPKPGSVPYVVPQWWGAKANGSVDDSAAVRSAIRAAVAGGLTGTSLNVPVAQAVFFPPGRYRLDADAVLSDIGTSTRAGLRLFGASYRATELQLVTDGITPKWFYDNNGINRLQFATFENLTFIGSGGNGGASSANGFRLTTTGHEQAHRFYNCHFQEMRTAFSFEGTANADRCKWFSCSFRHISERLLYVNNAQSVSHQFYGCEIDKISGHIFHIGPNGGGPIGYHGGSIVMESTDGTMRYCVYVESGSMGGSNGDVLFDDARFELNTAQNGVVWADGDAGLPRIRFENCNFWSALNGDREAVTIRRARRVSFRNCVLPAVFTYRVNTPVNVANSNMLAGDITFDN